MKNYIANEYGGWATSAGYVKYSITRAIHYGRVYTNGDRGSRGKEEDLCEALRCLGQALHCLEDFGAHTNYTELALRELGFTNVFPHTGVNTQMSLRNGKRVFPLVTGTFGGVDFLHSVLGEATDHFTQSELEQMDSALDDAAGGQKKSADGSSSRTGGVNGLIDVLNKVPGTGNLVQEAQSLQQQSDAQAAQNYGHGASRGDLNRSSAPQYGGPHQQQQYQQPPSFQAPPGSVNGPPGPGIPGMNPNIDPQALVAKIYPILSFRDKVVRAVSSIVSKIPGLERLLDTISERVTIFVFSLLAPFIQPVIQAASQSLKQGSSAVVDASGKHQYEVWTDSNCTDPTHSLLSKDHFSNVLNEPAGQVSVAILQYVAPRVIYAFENSSVPVDQVLNDVVRVFHHPALRDNNNEAHKAMFGAVEKWVKGRPDRGRDLDQVLSSESVKAGRNHRGGNPHDHSGGHGNPQTGIASFLGGAQGGSGTGGSSSSSGGGGFPGAGFLGSLTGAQSSSSSSGGGVGGLLGSLTGGHGTGSSSLSFLSGASGKRDFDGPTPPGSSGGAPANTAPQQQQFQHSHTSYGQNQAAYEPSGSQGQWNQTPQTGAQQLQNDPYAYPTAYQQGYEPSYNDQSQSQTQSQSQGQGQGQYGTGSYGQGANAWEGQGQGQQHQDYGHGGQQQQQQPPQHQHQDYGYGGAGPGDQGAGYGNYDASQSQGSYGNFQPGSQGAYGQY